jgi:hypothetical protein
VQDLVQVAEDVAQVYLSFAPTALEAEKGQEMLKPLLDVLKPKWRGMVLPSFQGANQI